MSTGGRDPVRAAVPRSPASSRSRTGSSYIRIGAIAIVSAGAVLAAGGGDAFWLCLPGVLLACAAARTRLAAALGAAVVTASGAAVAMVWVHDQSRPSPWLAVLVPAASAMVLVAARGRLEREREMMRTFALSDPLTGIANRRQLEARAEYELARHRRAQRSFALVMLDLDGFKLLNDRFGHPAGDELLRDVATSLQRSMRAQDTVARIGGDEFCVLAPETDEHGTRRLAARIAHAVSEVTAGIEVIRAGIGIAVFPADGITAADLMRSADDRLLRAKREQQRGRTRRRAA